MCTLLYRERERERVDREVQGAKFPSPKILTQLASWVPSSRVPDLHNARETRTLTILSRRHVEPAPRPVTIPCKKLVSSKGTRWHSPHCYSYETLLTQRVAGHSRTIPLIRIGRPLGSPRIAPHIDLDQTGTHLWAHGRRDVCHKISTKPLSRGRAHQAPLMRRP